MKKLLFTLLLTMAFPIKAQDFTPVPKNNLTFKTEDLLRVAGQIYTCGMVKGTINTLSQLGDKPMPLKAARNLFLEADCDKFEEFLKTWGALK